MKFFTPIQVWFRQWRRRQAAMKQSGALREFVYLDEVSVYSLIASRLGPIATEFTETETNSLQGEIGNSFGAGVGIAKADVNTHLLSGQTSGSQVLRKSIVQATFKELYELENASLVIRSVPNNLNPPKLHNFEELTDIVKTLEDNNWIIDPDRITRGQLLELEVQLEADPIFRVSAVFSAFHGIFEEDSEVLGVDSSDILIQIKSIGRVLEKLLVGLVPIRGQAIDYCVVEIENKEWIVNRRLLNILSTTSSILTYPLYVVGVAEQNLFWKDIRRILFSKARYRILCRAAQDGLKNSWTPVKLAHIIETVVPGFTSQIDMMGSNVLATMTDTTKSNNVMEPNQKNMRLALSGYAQLLADHYHLDLTSEDDNQIKLLSNQNCIYFGSQKERRNAFESIAIYLVDRFNLKRESLVFAQYREVALENAMTYQPRQTTQIGSSNEIPPTSSSGERFLDTEFVAIYW